MAAAKARSMKLQVKHGMSFISLYRPTAAIKLVSEFSRWVDHVYKSVIKYRNA